MNTHFERVGFGGGCHWCTEAVFQSLIGIEDVAQGFIKSSPPADTWSEAVIVIFNPEIIELAVLIEIHLRTHACTSHHKMRGKYRSAIYTYSETQTKVSQGQLDRLQTDFEDKIITNILPFVAFKSSDERFHNYYQTDPDRPFCKAYIDPKLATLRKLYADQFRAIDRQ